MTKKWTIERDILWWGDRRTLRLSDEQAAPEAWSEIGRDPSLPDTVDVLRDGTLIFTAPHDGATLDGYTLHFCGQGIRVDHRTRKGWRYIARPIPEPEPETVRVPLDACLMRKDSVLDRLIVAVDLGSKMYRVSGAHGWINTDADGHVEVLNGCEP